MPRPSLFKPRTQTTGRPQRKVKRAPTAAPEDAIAIRPAAAPPNLFAGTSGWAYPSWKPGFYPGNLRSQAFLPFYAAQLNSVEVNYTFRTLPSATQLQGWLNATPPGFRFSFKAPQRITHLQRLRLSDQLNNSLAEFLAALQPARTAAKLGPLLFQLPPNFTADHARLAAFLDAPALADCQLQLAFEFRHASWFSDATFGLLRARNIALCVAHNGDQPDDLATPDIATADFRYYRLRRSGGYTPAKLRGFARRFAGLARDGDVFVYFKHEDEPTGALNAVAMLHHGASKSQSRSRKPAALQPVTGARA